MSDDGGESLESDSPSGSLRDIHDISLNLKFSLDGDMSGAGGNDNSLDSKGNADRQSKLENVALSWSRCVLKDQRKARAGDKVEHRSGTGKFPALRRRRHIFAIAVDSDSTEDLLDAIRMIFEAVEKERIDGSIGFILSTFITIFEIHSFLVSTGLNTNDFDAFICNSGIDLFYSTINPEDGPFVIDFYYLSHIEYIWGGEGLRKTLVRWAGSITDKKAGNEEHIVTLDEQLSANYCYAFEVKNAEMVPPVKELQKVLRIQALRCNVVYLPTETIRYPTSCRSTALTFFKHHKTAQARTSATPWRTYLRAKNFTALPSCPVPCSVLRPRLKNLVFKPRDLYIPIECPFVV